MQLESIGKNRLMAAPGTTFGTIDLYPAPASLLKQRIDKPVDGRQQLANSPCNCLTGKSITDGGLPEAVSVGIEDAVCFMNIPVKVYNDSGLKCTIFF